MSDTNVEIVNLPFVAGLNKIPNDLITRDSIIELIIKSLKNNDIVFIEGDEGVGKTTLLLDFVWQNPYNVISHFIDYNYNYTYSYDCVLEFLYKQIYFYCNGEQFDSEVVINFQYFNSIFGSLFRKIKRAKNDLYFVFDGLERLNKEQLSILASIFDSLPWGKAKFIFVGTKEHLSVLFETKKLKVKEIPIQNFDLHQTRLYFKDITADEHQITEIHRLSKKGNPEFLNIIKRSCIENGGVTNFLEYDGLKEKEDLLENWWKQVDEKDAELLLILAIITFNDLKLTIQTISQIISREESFLVEKIKSLNFIDITETIPRYQSESFRNYIKKKLQGFEDRVDYLIIEYYEKNPNQDDSTFNLPKLYKKAQSWDKLTKFYSIDAFIKIIEQHQSMGNVNMHFSQGFDASKRTASKFNEAYLRFALHKSSIKELEKHELWRYEIEALIALNNYDQALLLANSAFLKEDRLKLLAILAKKRKTSNLPEDQYLIDQIKNLFDQIDFSKIKSKGFELAALLIYSNLELAIKIVETISADSSTDSLDYAFAYLSIYITEINKQSKTKIGDIDVLSAKIKNDDVKNITRALRFVSEEYNSEQIIDQVHDLNSFRHKLFILKNWILNNSESAEVVKVIKFTLNELISASNENVPNASVLCDIARPLPNLNDTSEIESIVSLFDALRNIDTPTKDYVKLQLLISEALLRVEIGKAKDRVFDVYLLIDGLDDLSTKTDCLSILWIYLIKSDKDNEIEKSISTSETIEFQVRKNFKMLLGNTAFHFKMTEFLASSMIIHQPIFVFEIISEINTLERRDMATKLAIITYIQSIKIEEFDFDILKTYYLAINDIIIKEEIILEVIDRFYEEKNTSLNYINELSYYYDQFDYVSSLENRCYVITIGIKILNLDNLLYEQKIITLLNKLYTSWNEIDSLWTKIEIGFKIANELADYSSIESQKYLQQSTDLKKTETFSSSSIANTYVRSARLAIRSFVGITLFKSDVDDELNKLYEIINIIQSREEKLILWSELALKVRAKSKVDLFNKIYKNFISPNIAHWDNINTLSRKKTIMQIAPSIFLYNRSIFDSYMNGLPQDMKNLAIRNVSDYILNKFTNDELLDEQTIPLKLEFAEFMDLCILMSEVIDDFTIHGLVEQTVKSLIKSKSHITIEQRNQIVSKIKHIINAKLPSRNGVQHEGYKIISEADLLTLESFNPNTWNQLIIRANLIPNLSDKALTLIVLAGKINSTNKTPKIQLMENAFEQIKQIPSIYDKTNRFDATWETWQDIDTAKFIRYLKLSYENLLQSKDGEFIGIRNIVDTAQQHDPELAEGFVTMLDKDPARRTLKAPLLRMIESNKKIKSACTEYDRLDKLSPSQFIKVFKRNLKDLNSDRISTKDITETTNILEKASELSLSDSFEAYQYFIQNAIKKYESNKKNPEILSSIFQAVIENNKLIAILSSDNVAKMKNLYISDKKSQSNPIIHPGESDLAVERIKSWIQENNYDLFYIIDPYFTENEIYILKWIQEQNPHSQVKILTSKKDKKNSHFDPEDLTRSTNKEVYCRSWEKISSESPLSTTIKIIWDKTSLECPFHDRWYVAGEGESCLYIGTSLNGLGKRESQIVELSRDQILDVKNLINKYMFREETKVGIFNLKYERFELE